MNAWSEAILVMTIAAFVILSGSAYFSRTYSRALKGALTAVGLISFTAGASGVRAMR